MSTPIYYWREKDLDLVDLDVPFECPFCGGHVALDATFFDQVQNWCYCPYCQERLFWPGEE
jgi:hypothetical protein